MEENGRPQVAPKCHECPVDYTFAKFIMNSNVDYTFAIFIINAMHFLLASKFSEHKIHPK
jgi:hypothetical protein